MGFNPFSHPLYERKDGETCTAYWIFRKFAAPCATEIHHKAKRRGKMLLDENFWLAVCRENHERIEADKAWARREGYLLNF